MDAAVCSSFHWIKAGDSFCDAGLSTDAPMAAFPAAHSTRIAELSYPARYDGSFTFTIKV